MRVMALLVLSLIAATPCEAQLRQRNESRISPPIPRLDPAIPRLGDPDCDRRTGRVYGPIYDPLLASWSRNSWGPFGTVGWSGGYYGPSFGFSVHSGYDYYSAYGPNWGGPVYAGPVSPWGPVWGGPPVVYQAPSTPLPEMPQWMLDEARFGRPEKLSSTARTHPGLHRPSTPEAQLRSVRMQGIGDRFLRDRDFAAAEKSFRSAIESAPDRPEPYVRLALTKVARDDYRGAVTALREVTAIDLTFPQRMESFDTLLGVEQHGLKVELKQRAADWTRGNVRDADRLFLLAVLLFLDGDERCHTLLDTAIKLAGEQDHLIAFRGASVPLSGPEEAIPVAQPPLPAPLNLPEPADATPIAPSPTTPRAPLLVPTEPVLPPEPTPVPDL